ncbi:MAG: RNA polymerase sigma factor [Actinomycetota bacterium]|nr:RNA polymerase sigma factor [Actinomycetota bacterium]
MNDTSHDRGDAAAEQAFREYVLPELDVLYRVALSITRNRTDAEDLVQDTLLRAFRSIERFDGRHPRAWLLTILRNAQLNRVRRKRPELLRDPDVTFERHADDGPAGSSAENRVVDELFDAAVEEAFTALSPKFRSVIELVDLDGLSYQEAADVLGVPVGTIMSRLHRARSRIREHIRQREARSEDDR